MGPYEETIMRQAIQAGHSLPAKILNAPELHIGLALYMRAFFLLDSERSHGMGITRIPWSSIASYAILHKLDPEQTEDLILYVQKMDEFTCKRLESKMKAQHAKST